MYIQLRRMCLLIVNFNWKWLVSPLGLGSGSLFNVDVQMHIYVREEHVTIINYSFIYSFCIHVACCLSVCGVWSRWSVIMVTVVTVAGFWILVHVVTLVSRSKLVHHAAAVYGSHVNIVIMVYIHVRVYITALLKQLLILPLASNVSNPIKKDL